MMTGRVYKSRVAKWYICACVVMVLVLIVTLILCYKSTWFLLIDVVFLGVGVWLMFDMLLHTYYVITGDKLHIRCGFLFRMDLPIRKITEITHKSTILSSPSLSAKRIGLRYGRRNWVYISPTDQDDFIAEIKSINPGIIIK